MSTIKRKEAVEITERTSVTDKEIGELRMSVGWDHNAGSYDKVLKGVHTYFCARENGKLIGFMTVISDGVADAFLVDLVVHSDFQKLGLGKRLVKKGTIYSKSIGVQCVHVTFNHSEEEFYRKCGFHIFGGGIIDFKHMKYEE